VETPAAELMPPVILALRPAEKDVAGGLHHPLPPHDPLSGLLIAVTVQVLTRVS
jgi:hypothetical protein